MCQSCAKTLWDAVRVAAVEAVGECVPVSVLGALPRRDGITDSPTLRVDAAEARAGIAVDRLHATGERKALPVLFDCPCRTSAGTLGAHPRRTHGAARAAIVRIAAGKATAPGAAAPPIPTCGIVRNRHTRAGCWVAGLAVPTRHTGARIRRVRWGLGGRRGVGGGRRYARAPDAGASGAAHVPTRTAVVRIGCEVGTYRWLGPAEATVRVPSRADRVIVISDVRRNRWGSNSNDLHVGGITRREMADRDLGLRSSGCDPRSQDEDRGHGGKCCAFHMRTPFSSVCGEAVTSQ